MAIEHVAAFAAARASHDSGLAQFRKDMLQIALRNRLFLCNTVDGYRALARKLVNVAKDCCEGRLAAVLEGGYDVDALGRSVLGVIEEMLLDGKKDDLFVAGRPTGGTAKTIDELKHLLGPYWKSL